MSKIALSGNASGTGTFTLASPNSNSDRTLNLPDNSGTVLTSATTTGFPAGSVIQVVSVENATQVATTSTSVVDTGLSASITPTSATSKILVIVNQTITPSTVGSNTFAVVQLFRGASLIWQDARANLTGQFVHTTPSANVLDAPATTSSVTYKTMFATGAAIYEAQAQHAGLRNSTITLMEIAA
jgi:hypothetical protein